MMKDECNTVDTSSSSMIHKSLGSRTLNTCNIYIVHSIEKMGCQSSLRILYRNQFWLVQLLENEGVVLWLVWGPRCGTMVGEPWWVNLGG
uniref:Uncharacterized protein n=1 Tax=Arion vulgaris TaxID=1028688 RepID=A0A0B6ZH08_9EUPU